MISASPRRLAVFKSIVDFGGFNVAAARLGIAQPSVGAHIKALEAQIGQALFFRHRGSKPQLTKAGEAFYAYAVEALRKSEETTHVLADLRKGEAREIAIAVHRDLATHVLPVRLAAFASRHPKIRIVTRIGTIEEAIELVRRHAVKLGLFLASGPVGGIRSEILSREKLALVVAPAHRLAGTGSVSADQISRFPFVTGLRGSRYFALVDCALAEIGIKNYPVAMELQESAAVKEVVRHGAGIACLPRCMVRSEIEAGQLVELHPTPPLPDLQLRCGYRAPLDDTTQKLLLALRAGK
jgi:DNA-binding transcriptional LysR family regulator